MIVNVYSIFDRASQLYSEPFVSVNDAVAVRKFDALCQGAQIMAPDLQLYKIGTFNQASGEVVPQIEFIQSAPNTIARTREVLKKAGGKGEKN